MEKKLTCIICPKGCELTVVVDGDNISVSGNTCNRGEQYGIDECINPTRTVTSIVRVENREDVMASVKTKTPIAKKDIFPLMEEIRKAKVNAPVKIGDTVIKDKFGTDVIITKNID